MEKEIKIKVDTEKKRLLSIDLPDGINPLDGTIILQSAAMNLISTFKPAEEKSKIIQPNKKIVTPGG